MRKTVLILAYLLLLLLTRVGAVFAQPQMNVTVDKNIYAAGETVIATMTLTDLTVAFKGPVSFHVEFVVHCGPASDYGCPAVNSDDTSAPISSSGTCSATAHLVLPQTITAGQYDLMINLTFTQGGKYSFGPFGPITVTNTPVPESSSILLLLLPVFLMAICRLRRKTST